MQCLVHDVSQILNYESYNKFHKYYILYYYAQYLLITHMLCTLCSEFNQVACLYT